MQFTSAWLIPSRVAQDDSVGTADWVETANLFDDDGDYLTQSFFLTSEEFYLAQARLVFNDALGANNEATGTDTYPFSNLGGASDKWGESSITGEQVSSEKFGVALAFGKKNGAVYTVMSYYLMVTGFGLSIPADAVVDGIEVEIDSTVNPTGGGTQTLFLDTIRIRFTYTWDISINAEATSFGGIYTETPNRKPPYKKFRFKVYSEDGDYLGDWKDYSEPKYKQDINNIIGSMPISFARNDLALDPQVAGLLNEDSSPLTDESDSPFLIDIAPTTGLGAGTTLDTNNDVVVDAIYGQFEALLNEDDSPILNEDGSLILVEDGYPLGRTIFRGYVPRWELPLDGSGISSEIRSYSQDLVNILLETEDTPYIDNSTRASGSYGINGGGPTDLEALYQTFTMAAEKTLSKVRLYPYAGWYFDVGFTVTVRGGTPASPTGITYGSGSGIVNRNNPVNEYDVVFSSPITLPAGTYYFDFTTPEYKTGGNPTYPFNLFTSTAYAGGSLYYVNSDQGLVNVTGADIAFILYEAGAETTVAFNSYDPSDILREVVDFANSRGARINYTADSIQNTNTTVSYTFRNQNIKQVIEKILELCPANWYYYYDFGTDTIYLKERSSTPDRWLRQGATVVGGKIIKTIEQVVNDVPFSGGGDPALYIRDTRAPADGTRRGLKPLSDNRVTSEDTAYILTGSEIDQLNQALYAGDVTITEDGNFYLEDVAVGEMLGFIGFGDLIDGIVVQSVSKNYSADVMPLALTYNVPRVNKRVEDIKRNLDTLETANNPVEPS
jgi:hypothetical protein